MKGSNKKPNWIRVRAPSMDGYKETETLMRGKKLHTVCEEAACPNIGECWKKKHATFLILGDICTRNCRFCNIKSGKPNPLDPNEPENVAKSVEVLQLKHVVITSVTRDDLEDGGASHYIKTIKAIRKLSPKTTIEILTPDFINKPEEITFKAIVEQSPPDVYNHNIETVPSLYSEIRKGARYFHSLYLLKRVKELNKEIFTKSGIMVGLGETNEEVFQVMNDMRSANIDFLTIGQYLRPTEKHIEVKRYVTPDEFELFKRTAISKGFSMVSSSPLTRSSYHAGDGFEKLKENLKCST